MIIKYGLIDNNIDITNICLSQFNNNNIIIIPPGDIDRAIYFTDPLPGILKKIFIYINDNLTIHEYNFRIEINILTNTITSTNYNDIDSKMQNIHSKLKIKYGNFDQEVPEQKMAITYLTGNEKVLELGGNIGRNSLVIASILHDSRNLVTLESDLIIAEQLIENKELNNLNFIIEGSALSKRKLIQKDWNTEISDVLKEDYKWVNTITFDELKNKYNIDFDTLVLDCEGAFYYILIDMPEILNNINLIIMENDYHDVSYKQYIDLTLLNNNFYRDYVEVGGWGCCNNNFFEVWKK